MSKIGPGPVLAAVIVAFGVGIVAVQKYSHPEPERRVLLRSEYLDSVPIAPKNAEDLETFSHAGPAVYMNGTPTDSGDTETQTNLRGSGRILLIPVGTTARVLRTEGGIPFIEVLDGPDKGSQGWIANRYYTEQSQPVP